MILMSKCRGDWDLGVCTTSALAFKNPLRNGKIRFFLRRNTFSFGSRHCAAVLQTQVLKWCTDLDLSLILRKEFLSNMFQFFGNNFQYLRGISQDISVSFFDSRRSLSSANRRRSTSPIFLSALLTALWSARQEDPNDLQERCTMARTSCARL